MRRKIDYWAGFCEIVRDLAVGALAGVAFLIAIWTSYIW